jgi:hypothetical protein
LEFQDCGETTLDDDGTQASDRGLVGSVDGMEHGCAPLGEALIFKRSSRILVHHIQIPGDPTRSGGPLPSAACVSVAYLARLYFPFCPPIVHASSKDFRWDAA